MFNILLILVYPFGLFILAIVLSVLRFTDYVYPFGIFNLFVKKTKAAIKNGQSRDTGNSGHTRHRKKTNKMTKKLIPSWTTNLTFTISTKSRQSTTLYICVLGLKLWCFNNISVISCRSVLAVGGNRSTQRKPPIHPKLLTNFITKYIEYKTPWARFELTTLVVISGTCKSNYHTITTKTGLLGTRLMCLSGAVCLPMVCWFSELALLKSSKSDFLIISSNDTSHHGIDEKIWCYIRTTQLLNNYLISI